MFVSLDKYEPLTVGQMRFDKIAGSDFEQPKAGPEGARHRECAE
jgi:hypothetical protein